MVHRWQMNVIIRRSTYSEHDLSDKHTESNFLPYGPGGGGGRGHSRLLDAGMLVI